MSRDRLDLLGEEYLTTFVHPAKKGRYSSDRRIARDGKKIVLVAMN
jgi:hypothetical protein